MAIQRSSYSRSADQAGGVAQPSRGLGAQWRRIAGLALASIVLAGAILAGRGVAQPQADVTGGSGALRAGEAYVEYIAPRTAGALESAAPVERPAMAIIGTGSVYDERLLPAPSEADAPAGRPEMAIIGTGSVYDERLLPAPSEAVAP